MSMKKLVSPKRSHKTATVAVVDTPKSNMESCSHLIGPDGLLCQDRVAVCMALDGICSDILRDGMKYSEQFWEEFHREVKQRGVVASPEFITECLSVNTNLQVFAMKGGWGSYFFQYKHT